MKKTIVDSKGFSDYYTCDNCQSKITQYYFEREHNGYQLSFKNISDEFLIIEHNFLDYYEDEYVINETLIKQEFKLNIFDRKHLNIIKEHLTFEELRSLVLKYVENIIFR